MFAGHNSICLSSDIMINEQKNIIIITSELTDVVSYCSYNISKNIGLCYVSNVGTFHFFIWGMKSTGFKVLGEVISNNR